MGYTDTDNINIGDIMSDMDVIGIWMAMIIDMIVRSVSATWYRTNVRPPHFCQYTPIPTRLLWNISRYIYINITQLYNYSHYKYYYRVNCFT